MLRLSHRGPGKDKRGKGREGRRLKNYRAKCEGTKGGDKGRGQRVIHRIKVNIPTQKLSSSTSLWLRKRRREHG